jgi:hypothetical protein
VVRHQLIGNPAEHQPTGGVALLDRQFFEFVAPDVEMPGDVAVWPFDETVERHQVPHDQLRHRDSLPTTCILQLVVF